MRFVYLADSPCTDIISACFKMELTGAYSLWLGE